MNKSENITNINDIDIKSEDLIGDDGDKKCAPGKVFENGSCFSLNILVEMANAYNDSHDKNQIKLFPSFETLNRCKYKKYLLREFKKRLDDVCDNQQCWTKQPFIKKMKKLQKEELQRHMFRPTGPQGKFEWLNTIHIMKQ